MKKEIKQFYKLTKNNRIKSEEIDPPISFIHIFHKEYPRLESIDLPNVRRLQHLDSLFEKRRSTRDFDKKPLTLRQVAEVLHSCRIVQRGNEFERRTYPSAGARFPIEIYLVSFNVKNVAPGAYHFNSLNNSLELLLNNDLTGFSGEIVSTFIKNPSLAIIMTSVIPRAEIKYSYKAYPFSLIEAGHIGQNIYLACAERDIGCCAIGGYVDDRISKTLDLTEDEIPIYSFALGNIRKDE